MTLSRSPSADQSTRTVASVEGAGAGPRLGLRENWRQFFLFSLITLLVGMTIGVERVALPPLARHIFGVTSILYTVSFVSAFGAVKAVMNLVAGRLSDRHGRKRLMLAGWAMALPYALLIIFARAWWWVLLVASQVRWKIRDGRRLLVMMLGGGCDGFGDAAGGLGAGVGVEQLAA